MAASDTIDAAMPGADVCARELVSIDCCTVVKTNSFDASQHEPVSEGTLKVLALPPVLDAPVDAPERILLSITNTEVPSSDSATMTNAFFYPVLPETPVWIAGSEACLTFPASTGEEIYGLFFGSGGIDLVVEQLKVCGCIVRQKQEEAVAQRVDVVQGTSETIVDAINTASGLLSWGVQQATAAAKESSLLNPRSQPLQVPSSLRDEVKIARSATREVVLLSSSLVESITKKGQQMAAHLGDFAQVKDVPGLSGTDTSIGRSTIGAGLDIFSALSAAAEQAGRDVASSSSELVGHKFGSEAGETARDMFHVAGNMIEAKGQATTKGIAKGVAKQTLSSIAEPANSNSVTNAARVPKGIIMGPRPVTATASTSLDKEIVMETPVDPHNFVKEAGTEELIQPPEHSFTSTPSEERKPSTPGHTKTGTWSLYMMVSGVVACLVAAVVMWPLVCVVFLLSILCALLGLAVLAFSRRATALEKRLAQPLLQPGWMEDISASAGMQKLQDEAFSWARAWAASTEFSSMIRHVETGEAPPKVLAVRMAPSPAPDCACFDVDVALVESAVLPHVDIQMKMPGCTEPHVVRIVLTHFQGTVQVYCWSKPPEGRGNGKPYSLIEVALAPQPFRPPVFAVELAAATPSKVLSLILPHMRQVAATVLESQLLPRLTGFERRLVFQESPSKGRSIDGELRWEQEARRAGWIPRAEAELESAVSEMMRRTTTQAHNAVVGASEVAAGLARGGASTVMSLGAKTSASVLQKSKTTPLTTNKSDAATKAVNLAAGAASMLGRGLTGLRGRSSAVPSASTGIATTTATDPLLGEAQKLESTSAD